MSDILAVPTSVLPRGAAIPGFVVLLGDRSNTLTRVEALVCAADSATPIDAAALRNFALSLSEADSDGHVWHVCTYYPVADVVDTVGRVRSVLRAATRGTAPSRSLH
jgi:hypothetical protein